MNITYDPSKNASNIKKHGLSFDDVPLLQWEYAYQFVDERYDYGEVRISAYVPWCNRLYFVAYTERAEGRRIISFRKANHREVIFYEKQQN